MTPTSVCLKRVFLYDARLEGYRASDDSGEGLGLLCQQRLGFALQSIEIVGIKSHSMLDDLSPAFGELSPGQCEKQRRVRQHQSRLIEGSYEVLSRCVIDAYFASNR